MRAVIYLVSGVLTGFLLFPPPLLSALGTLFQPLPEVQDPGSTIALVPDADTAYARTAFLRGTNKVATETLLRAGLAPDALEKGADLDGDGDPDDIHLRLEVVTVSAAEGEHWAFVPKAFGLAQWQVPQELPAVSSPASPDLRMEQGDTVLITLENSFHLPLALQFEGVDAEALSPVGPPADLADVAMPGEARTYRLTPVNVGEGRYGAQDATAVTRGLQGRVIVEENRPDNTLVTVDTAWQLRVPPFATVLADTSVAAAMDTSDLLQFSGFGLALGLALAGLGGLLLPMWRKRPAPGRPT